jgi:hypothetical protein
VQPYQNHRVATIQPDGAYRLKRLLVLLFGTARVKQHLMRFSEPEWACERLEQPASYRFTTLKSAVRAFNNRETKAAPTEQADPGATETADMENDNQSALT